MGKRSIATIVATVVAAIVVAGGAAAASRYLVTSIHQIKPSVLKHLQAQLLYVDEKGPIATMCPSGTDTTGQCETAGSDARCPNGGIATGGGFDGGSSPPVGAFMGYNEPDSDGGGWHIIMGNSSSGTTTFQTVVVCIAISRLAGAAEAGAPSSVRTQISRELSWMRARR